MSETLTLTMPDPKKLSAIKKIPYIWLLASAFCILLLASLIWWFFTNKNVSSVWAVIDGNVYSVSSQFPGIVEAITVNEGDNVVVGQSIGRMVSVNGRYMDLSKNDLSSFRPPDLAEMEYRIKQAEEAEKKIVLRIGKARQEEDNKKRIFEQSANDFAKAQYQRRSIDSQRGEHGIGQLQSAQKIENDRLANKEKSREEFELASRTRAALDQELARIRDEINRAKQIVSQSRYQRSSVPTNTRQSTEAVSTIYATANGKVVRCNVKAGQEIRQGDPLILVAPNNLSEKQVLWVLAYFSMDDADNIKQGQKCEIVFDQSGVNYQGKIDYIDTPRLLPTDAGIQLKDGVSSNFLPVRIELENTNNQTPSIGASAKCTIKFGLF